MTGNWPMTRKHILCLPHHLATLTVGEFPDKIVFKLDLHSGSFGDEPRVVSWLTQLLEQYDDDKRALLIGDPFTGNATVSVHGSARDSMRASLGAGV